jgi:2-desacetyl-2-hydroxyethyl bacteriochlorophyllide A dehydrogenase
MAKKMKAVVCSGPKKYALEIVNVPVVKKEDLLIKIEGCGICAGDAKAATGAAMFWGDDTQPAWMTAPVIPGHEFVGQIVEIGTEAKAKRGLAIGDRVVVEQIVPCGECRFCKSGKYWMCNTGHDIIGFKSHLNGGMAEYMKFPAQAHNFKVPDDLPIEKAILIEPFACSKHCVDRANIGNEDVVVLSGAGTLGLGMVGAIRLKNPRTLVVLDIKDDRLALAKKFGADIIINPSKENAVGKIVDMTEGYGCDVYIEATGHPGSVRQGLEAIRKMGTFVEFSVFKDMTLADWSIISDRKELNLYGSHLSPYCYETVIEWISDGKLPTEGVVTHKLSLENWQKGFELAEKGDNSLKVILTT